MNKQTSLVVITSSRSGLGKTLLGELIIRSLKKKLHKIIVIKHVHHSIDYKVKDTGRFLSAGADVVVAVSQDEVMRVEKKRVELTKLLKNLVGQYDIIIVEGFKEQLESLDEIFYGYCRIHIVEENELLHEERDRDSTRIRVGRNKLSHAAKLIEQYVTGRKCTIKY